MKGKAGLLLLSILCAVVGFAYAAERVTTASTAVAPSPLFAASLNRSISELEGKLPKRRNPSSNLAARGAARVDDTSLAPDCTQYSGCVVTIGGPSCDYSLCEGCNYTFFNMDYTCNGGPSCGPPTQGSGPTCAQWSTCSGASTCGASTCFGDNTCNVNSTACHGGATSSGNTCAGSSGATCSAPSCTPPTSVGLPTCDNRPGTGCGDNQVTVSGTTCNGNFPTCGGNTCSSSFTCGGGFTCGSGYTCESAFECDPRGVQ